MGRRLDPMLVDDSKELFDILEALDLLKEKPKFWWPAYGTFEVVVGAILTQNTQWEKVEKSLQALKDASMLSLEALATCDREYLQSLIKASGLYKTKAKYLQLLSKNIVNTFGDFDTFVFEVSRDFLLSQKGIGFESADAILAYACGRESVMVVDTYTARLLQALGYEFEDYHDIQTWLTASLPAKNANYVRFHGMIVEYCKGNSKGKMVSIDTIKKGKI